MTMTRHTTASASLLSLVLLAGCGIRENLEQRISEEIAEKVVEVAAGGEIDVETRDGKVTVVGKDGSLLEANGEVPTDFPIALPEIAKVVSTQRTEAADKSKSVTLIAEAKSKDLQVVAKDIAADLEAKGLTLTRNEIATGEGTMIVLAGKNEAAALEANCVISSSTDAERPGLQLMLSWIDRSAVDPG